VKDREFFAFSALTLLSGRQEGLLVCFWWSDWSLMQMMRRCFREFLLLPLPASSHIAITPRLVLD